MCGKIFSRISYVRYCLSLLSIKRVSCPSYDRSVVNSVSMILALHFSVAAEVWTKSNIMDIPSKFLNNDRELCGSIWTRYVDD
jgi:hypothetical protein